MHIKKQKAFCIFPFPLSYKPDLFKILRYTLYSILTPKIHTALLVHALQDAFGQYTVLPLLLMYLSQISAPISYNLKLANGKRDSHVCSVGSLAATVQVYKSPLKSSHFHKTQHLQQWLNDSTWLNLNKHLYDFLCYNSFYYYLFHLNQQSNQRLLWSLFL